MKEILKYIVVIALLVSFSACDKEEVMTFEGERGINFINYESAYGTYEDDYKNLKSEHNFVMDYSEGDDITMTLPDYQIEIGVQLEGEFSDVPIKVKVKADAVEGYDMADIVLPDEIVIEPGEYRTHFSVTCKQPKVYNRELKAKLVFDYANSDVVAGTKERQEYIITVSDALIWEDMYVDSLQGWNDMCSPYLGTADDVKIRFIYVALKKGGYNYIWANACYQYIAQGRPTWGFTNYEKNCIRQQLDAYNEAHDEPLSELDGTLVTFPF